MNKDIVFRRAGGRAGGVVILQEMHKYSRKALLF